MAHVLVVEDDAAVSSLLDTIFTEEGHQVTRARTNTEALPPTWTAEELGRRASIERFFGRVFSQFSCFLLQRLLVVGWSAVATQVGLVYAAAVVVGLAAQQGHRPDLIRSPTRVLAHLWEEVSCRRAK